VRVLGNDYLLANMSNLTTPNLSPNLPTSYFTISVQRLISSLLVSEVRYLIHGPGRDSAGDRIRVTNTKAGL
jgi:hypothetical protein